jgi:hypothetical protein
MWAIAIPVCFLLGVGICALLGMAYSSGYEQGKQDASELSEEGIEKAFRAGWIACEVSAEAAEDFDSSDHVQAQRRNAGQQ